MNSRPHDVQPEDFGFRMSTEWTTPPNLVIGPSGSLLLRTEWCGPRSHAMQAMQSTRSSMVSYPFVVRLRDLDAVLLRRVDDRTYEHVDRVDGADGVMFLCPLCFEANKGPVGTHSVICWFVGRVPADETPGPGRWTPTGETVDDLSFVCSPGRSNSVQLTSGCRWHGFVENGDARTA